VYTVTIYILMFKQHVGGGRRLGGREPDAGQVRVVWASVTECDRGHPSVTEG
jgi:hypothetical protein